MIRQLVDPSPLLHVVEAPRTVLDPNGCESVVDDRERAYRPAIGQATRILVKAVGV